jgi:glycosyltransferase involved in cell wall biosynthesis
VRAAGRTAATATQPPTRRRSVLLLGGLPPPTHGSSLMTAALRRTLERHGGFAVTMARLGRPKSVAEIGRWSLDSARFDGRVVARLAGWLRQGRRFDVAYLAVSQGGPALLRDLLVWVLALRLADRTVVHVHGGELGERFRGWRAPAARHLGRRTELWALSPQLVAGLRRAFGQHAGIEVVRNASFCGCDAARSQPTAAASRIGYLGAISADKGVDTLLQAVTELAGDRAFKAALARLGRSCTLELVGAPRPEAFGAEVAAACARIQALGDGLVGAAYLGPVTRPAARCALLRGWDLAVLVSRYRLEGQPLALIEAATHGCALVANDYRALTDIAIEPATGWIVPGGEGATAAATAAVLRGALLDPKETAARGARAAELARARFGPAAFEHRVLDLLSERLPGAVSAAQARVEGRTRRSARRR